MSRNGKVIVAMSGGVDSSVAASLLKEQGYECVGVFMWLGNAAPDRSSPASAAPIVDASPPSLSPSSVLPQSDASADDAPPRARQGCCSLGDACDARAVAGRLGIPFYTLDFGREFARLIDYFVDEYARARTPNPCVRCNTEVKFGRLLAYADAVDAQYIATGHYARVLANRPAAANSDASVAAPAAVGAHRLARALHAAKDQSYALFGIRREDLARCLFPVGEVADKRTVRSLAAALGLATHDKPESQEICFVPNDDYKSLVRARRPETVRPGPIVNALGQVLGTHAGIVNFTVGQRRGLGIAAAHPLYVTRLDAATDTVVVGPRAELYSAGLLAEQMNWLTDPPPIDTWRPVAIQIRYNHTAAAGRICVRGDGTVTALFDTPQPAVTPGQAAVFYADDIVLGGGWIRGAWADDDAR